MSFRPLSRHSCDFLQLDRPGELTRLILSHTNKSAYVTTQKIARARPPSTLIVVPVM